MLAGAVGEDGANVGQVLIYLLVGLGAIVAGVMIVRFRKALWEQTRKRQRRLVGRSASAAFERLQSSFWVGFVGVIAVGIGLTMICLGIASVVRLASS